MDCGRATSAEGSRMTERQTDVVLRCPEIGCGWSTTFDPKAGFERESKKVDAALHYVNEHGGKIPDEANFGHQQCPECYDILGFNGTASCSECGYIPQKVRA